MHFLKVFPGAQGAIGSPAGFQYHHKRTKSNGLEQLQEPVQGGSTQMCGCVVGKNEESFFFFFFKPTIAV